MATVKGPLFSVAATGKFNNLLEFRTGSGKTTVHGIRACPATRSQAQQAQALRFAQAVSGWQALSTAQKNTWKAAAVYTGHNGYQLYISEYQTQNINPPQQPVVP
ncbi:hypothetical protein [Methylobacter psychrophilus]|uniref:hypothetical protein n=1 Tax=Methylobacter psychrophilus TaxID=96941 RepID=UPI0021D4C6D9|nr:hypothetical protein [Methylobacter psychrophilus]